MLLISFFKKKINAFWNTCFSRCGFEDSIDCPYRFQVFLLLAAVSRTCSDLMASKCDRMNFSCDMSNMSDALTTADKKGARTKDRQ